MKEKITNLHEVRRDNNANQGGGSKLIIRTFGGTEDVNKTMTVYEYGGEMIIVDCGIGFPDIMDMPGVDILIPDFSYVLQNSHKLKGIFLTHAHEDHIGAIPYLLQDLPQTPVYTSRIGVEMLKEKFQEKVFKSFGANAKIHTFDPSKPVVSFKNFKIKAVNVMHSIPEAQGFAINTPEGLVMHMGEYKFDPTPVLEDPIDKSELSAYGNKGVSLLVSDCLHSTVPGFTKSEKTLSQTYLDLMAAAKGKQVFVTMISSSVSRLYQVIDAAHRHGRKIVVNGRSLEKVKNISQKLGYLPFPKDIYVDDKDVGKHQQSDLLYIMTGCFGQENSALGRLSRHEHNTISMEKGALVIFSGEGGPPEAAIAVEKLMDTLIMAGADIVYGEIQANLHVSGHGTQGDLGEMAKLLKPKYFFPVGGSVTRMRGYKNLMGKIGFKKENVFECLEGEGVEISRQGAKKTNKVQTVPVYISTNKASEISPVVVEDRDKMSDSGIFVVVIPRDRKGVMQPSRTEIVTRGFVYVKDSKELMEKSKKVIAKAINKSGPKGKDWSKLRHAVEKELDRFLYKEMGRAPVIIVHSISL
jgi:ribonuclease J